MLLRLTFFVLAYTIHTTIFACQKTFIEKPMNSGWFVHEAQIDYVVDESVVGYIGYTRIPFSVYIIHSFYVYPQFRNQGYGKTLLIYVRDLLLQRGAKKIFIQPGPFELVDGRVVDIDDIAEEVALEKLVKLYREVGFQPANKLVLKCADLIYKIMNIDEYARYLMVM